jgi:hypothetical protein
MAPRITNVDSTQVSCSGRNRFKVITCLVNGGMVGMYVTSYGDHFPLFIWEEGTWYENIEKITVTTSPSTVRKHIPMKIRYP